MKKSEPVKKKRQISAEQKQSLLERLALARANNPNHNKMLKLSNSQSIEESPADKGEGTKAGISPYLKQYLASNESIHDFKKLRIESPKDALTIAMDRVWGKPSQANPVGGKTARTGIAVLIQLLSGQKDTPQPVVPERYIPEGDAASSTDIIVNNQEVE